MADTYLTQYEINDLLVDFLYESSWTGFEHEELEDMIKDLEERSKEADEHKDDPNYFMSSEELLKRLEKEGNFEFEKKDAKQEEAYKKLVKHIIEYDRTCRVIELQKLKDKLKY